MPSETTLAGYTLLDRIAVGGMAEVYKARAPADEARTPDEPELVVLKRLHPELKGEDAYVRLFLEEGKLCVKLRHANVVRTLRVFKKGTDYFMVQELVSGAPLSRLIEVARARARPVDLAAAVHAVTALMKALEYVHQVRLADGGKSIVHRDVNPANLLCGPDGAVKLTDFGVAEAEGQPALAPTGALKGTLAYLSPEAVLGRPVDRRSDLYGAGIILWELAANRALFSQGSELEILHKLREGRVPRLSKVRPDVPELLEQIARKALFSDPNLRFQSAGEFQKALAVLEVRAGLGRGPEALATEVEQARRDTYPPVPLP